MLHRALLGLHALAASLKILALIVLFSVMSVVLLVKTRDLTHDDRVALRMIERIERNGWSIRAEDIHPHIAISRSRSRTTPHRWIALISGGVIVSTILSSLPLNARDMFVSFIVVCASVWLSTAIAEVERMRADTIRSLLYPPRSK